MNFVSAYEIDNYPLILVHGHGISTGEAANFLREYKERGDFGPLSNFQSKLEEDGLYFNKHIIIPYYFTQSCDWDKRISVRMTYYVDENGNFDDSKSIEVYAERLREVINIVKQCTKSDKVNLVGYSMGGLVIREYARNNPRNVNKIITLGTPNYGVENVYSGGKSSLCSQFRYENDLECGQMKINSNFLKTLNANNRTNIYTISGVIKNKEYFGLICQDYNSCNDGLICLKLAQIPGAKNYVVYSEKPSASIKYLSRGVHIDLADPETEAGFKTYEIVKKILSNEDVQANEKEWDERCILESKNSFKAALERLIIFIKEKLEFLIIKR